MLTQKKILAVATNENPMLNGHRTGLWLSELTHFVDVVEAAGYVVDVVSPRGGAIPLDEGSSSESQMRDPANARAMANPRFRETLRTSRACNAVVADDYAAIYLSGGHGTMWDFRQSAALRALMGRMHEAGAWITGVCHGVSGFVDAADRTGRKLVEGRRVTGFSNLEDTLARSKHAMPFLLEDALKASGARYKKALVPFTRYVQLDGKLITGQNPQSAKAVGQQLIAQLKV